MSAADLPRAGLARVLAELGTTLLDVVCGDVQRADESGAGSAAGIGGIVIHDPLDEPALPERALVLGVGLHESREIAAVVTQLGAQGAIGLVVRGPVEADDQLRAAVQRAGVPVLAFTRGASWTQLAGMLRVLTADEPAADGGDPVLPTGTLGRAGAGLRQVVGYQSGLDDLFAVANAIAALVDAPVTIEDRNSRLLAFSSRQEEVDTWRVQTILRRQVPEDYTRILEERGVFQEIYRSDRPVWVGPIAEGEQGRAAIAVRAGDEILGTIWAVAAEAFDEARGQALYDAAKLVAMHLVWQRADADVERRLRAELISTALESGPRTPETIRRLGLKDEPSVVLALTVVGSGTELPLPAQLAVERKRLADAFAVHLTAVHPRSAAGLVGDVAYGILPVARGGEERAAELAADFLSRVDSRLRPLVGVGPLAPGSAALQRSRSGADRALRVLRSRVTGRQVARLDDVHLEALLLELADRVPKGDLPSGPVARLVAYDRAHQSSLVDTLRAWLDAFGDVAIASAAMYVHANTFRYRLRRAAEVGGLDLADPNARLAAMLQLRLMDLSATSAE
ncbi:PucR family transcriptional regulator [Pimelobacter simplex]|uniref:Putative DNA-binding protein n=1 Tax=Nocardioides simplex TaxID=2045 RepID=A0A0A1DI35_NOCSI|nr:helix-turn-helix domain-containing protein [Pimelobacter simplex]AIY16954.1 putative DNA-binding protein [Pimelobacter simplex]MCG8152109.1 PucR family transcriptional regulator [Pimelobacter simplex]GEB12859.1 PucR family transcriptional regulator [Pimelobacter simplex]SFM53197.1 PucR C-terminal helix-turn-helix domain-containing protein [Pimelobacter simplex]